MRASVAGQRNWVGPLGVLIITTTVQILLGCKAPSGSGAPSGEKNGLAPPGPAMGSAKALDLSLDISTRDPNGLPLNPRWGSQPEVLPSDSDHPKVLPSDSDYPRPDVTAECGAITLPGRKDAADPPGAIHFEKPCTSQLDLLTLNELTKDVRGIPLLCAGTHPSLIHGHLNWKPVTYIGRLYWSDYAADGDINFYLATSRRYGYTTANPNGLELEFARSETLDYMHGKESMGTVWHRLWDAATMKGQWSPMQGQTPPSAVSSIIGGGETAIVSGLLGLDGVHQWHAELHPVLALAANTASKPQDEVWAVFVRNMGNEGMCSESVFVYSGTTSGAPTFAFEIPWPKDASGREADDVEVLKRTSFHWQTGVPMNPQYDIVLQPRKTLLLTFTLPPAVHDSDYAMAYGELHLKWSSPPVRDNGPARPGLQTVKGGAEDEPEAKLREFFSSVPRARQGQLINATKGSAVSRGPGGTAQANLPGANRLLSVEHLSTPPTGPQAAANVGLELPSPRKRAADLALVRQLCRADPNLEGCHATQR